MSNKNKIVGGDFILNNYKKKENKFSLKKKLNFFSNSRSAFDVIIKNLDNKKKILIPDYLCGNVLINVLNKNNKKYFFYKINKNFKIDINQFKEINNLEFDSILIINYFGIEDNLNFINKFNKIFKEIKIIYDCVQNPWFFINIKKKDFKINYPRNINYAFTNLSKTFPVPNGALLISKKILIIKKKIKSELLVKHWLLGATKKKNYLTNNTINEKIEKKYLRNFKIANKIYNKYYLNFSNLSLKILNSIKLNKYLNTKIKNYIFLSKYLLEKKVNIKNKKPFYLPILVKKRDKVQTMLRKMKYFFPHHWKKDDRIKNCGIHSKFIYQNELSIVIDQRISKNDLYFISKLIKPYLIKKYV